MADLTLYGSHVSPYVRKTRLVLAFKSLQYKHIPVIPRSPDQPQIFKDNSPLGKIPLLQAGESFISDSSVIFGFLEREYNEHPLLPEDNILAAKAMWFEEYADSRMVSVIGGHLFAERILAKALFKREPVQSDIDLALEQEIPEIFNYLTSELKSDYLVGNTLTIADIAVCGVFISLGHCGEQCDSEKWPTLAAYFDRVTSLPEFQKIITEEKMMLKAILGS